MFSCTHKVQYYETDKMGIVHHSNYIRWFEEARTSALEEMGIGYHHLEELGVISPIISVNANYKTMSKFGESVIIKTKIAKYSGVRLVIEIEIFDEKTGILRCTGETASCFLNDNGMPINLKKYFPDIHEIFEKYKEK